MPHTPVAEAHTFPRGHGLRPWRVPRRLLAAPRETQICLQCLILLARSEGFEPPTPRFEVWCSIQLSYERRGFLQSAGPLSGSSAAVLPADRRTQAKTCAMTHRPWCGARVML